MMIDVKSDKRVIVTCSIQEAVIMGLAIAKICRFDQRCEDPGCCCNDIRDSMRDTLDEATNYIDLTWHHDLAQGFKKH